jgi:hypothetical protein
MSQLAIIETFENLPDKRRRAGLRHQQSLCLALFTLAIAAGNRGFLAIGDWLRSYQDELLGLFKPEKNRLPSYSTIRRVLLQTDEAHYAQCLSRFFKISPKRGETIALDGKTLKHSFMTEADNPNCQPHPAIMMVTAYLIERGLILPPYEVERKTNEITALPEVIKQLASKGVVFAFDAINTQKKQRS